MTPLQTKFKKLNRAKIKAQNQRQAKTKKIVKTTSIATETENA